MAKQRLRECHFLIPLRRDAEISDGEYRDVDAWYWLEDELIDRFEGWSKSMGVVEGVWKSSATGRLSHDRSYQFHVAMPPTRLRELRKLLRIACVKFAQQCIYLSIAGLVEFVEPRP